VGESIIQYTVLGISYSRQLLQKSLVYSDLDFRKQANKRMSKATCVLGVLGSRAHVDSRNNTGGRSMA
jgi:hypothetical protein